MTTLREAMHQLWNRSTATFSVLYKRSRLSKHL